MVRRVGGRERGLVQAFLRLTREGAGRAAQNLEQTLKFFHTSVGGSGSMWSYPRRASGKGGEKISVVDSGPRTNNKEDIGQQTYPRRLATDPRQWQGHRQGDQVPLPHPDFLMIIILLLWGTLWLITDVPIAKTSQLTYLPCHPIL